MKNNSLEDVFLGILTLLLNGLLLILVGNWVEVNIIFISILVLYVLRITIHLIVRFGGEDSRYGDIREELMKNGYLCYLLGAFFLFTFYSLFIVLFSIPTLYMILYATEGLPWLAIVGAAVAFTSFLLEALADWQLEKFRADPANKGTMNKIGLWRYSRHPNYFFDTLMWWGFSMMAWTIPGGWMTVWVPILQTILMRYVTGVPLLEEKFKDRPSFKEYCEETSAFLPWFVNYKKADEEGGVPSEKKPLLDGAGANN
eukprot:CAMPEP_0170541074 /NCGR_PEP_ID=MMETSP0211-20121228/914_1 /TAXON_ID=311385 /ORGANISM="Pseudokeronopsis sp., Strain OXSARD2" /LENGTH=256 /DNA_ID=CAMNT_0010843679 /DNA_START=110 /DNA_END=880 /DNA_ORIENTATION=+